jgi:hypothetical protein
MTSTLGQPHIRHRRLLVHAAASVVVGLLAAPLAFADGTQEHRGASMLTVAGVAPNIARCGAFPPNVEVQFTGQGTDTGGGPFTSAASACQNVVTNEVFDLISVDTYWTGDSITILSEPFVLVLNPATCLATNPSPVKYTLPGGTGIFANARGKGRYHIYVTDAGCSGVILPAQVAFEGKIKL